MKKFIIIFFILFINIDIFSLVNSIQLNKRFTNFGPCPSGDGAENSFLIALQPDPPPINGGDQEIDVSLILNNGIIDTGSQYFIGFFDNTGAVVAPNITLDFCAEQGGTCPFKPLSSLIQTVTVQFPSTLPTSYNIVMEIIDSTNNIIACTTGAVNS